MPPSKSTLPFKAPRSFTFGDTGIRVATGFVEKRTARPSWRSGPVVFR